MKTRLPVIPAVFLYALLTGAVLFPDASVHAADAARAGVFALKREPAGVGIEFIPLADHETKVLRCGPDGDYIDVILPPDPGGSAAVVNLDPERMLILRHEDGEIRVTERRGDGKGWTRPARRPEDLRRYHIRVSLTDHDGSGWAFVIKEYARAAEDKIGPVVDLFGGKVPLGEHGYIVCTDTYRVNAYGKAYGEFPLDYARHLFTEARIPGGEKGVFLVDLGGAVTVVAQSYLPEGTSIEQANTIQYSPSGKELLKYEPGGATGKVQTVLGHASLPELQVGAVKFSNVNVVVMEHLPDFFDRDIVGILGIDLLQRAETVSFSFGADGSKLSTLKLGRALPGGESGTVELPFAVVNGHLMIRIQVNDVPVSFILDTGAPNPILDAPAAKAAGIEGDRKSAQEARGLDGGTASIIPANPGTVRLNARELDEIPFFVGSLPVFNRMNSRGQKVGLLGNSFFARFKRMDIDFEAEVVRFVP